jgi:hypothetical protein
MALLVTEGVNAAINIDDGMGKVSVARETVLTNATTEAKDDAKTKHYNIVNATNVLDFVVARGISTAVNTEVFYRFEFENMVFGSVVAAGQITGTGAAHYAGGAIGENYVVVTSNDAATATDTITIGAGTVAVLLDEPVSVTVTIHSDGFDARDGTNPRGKAVTLADAIQVVDGIEERGNSGGSVADVSTGFTRFTGDVDTRQIGRLRINHVADVHSQASAPITALTGLLDSTDPITVTYMGDFSVGTFSLNDESSCAGAGIPSTVNSDKDELTPNTQPDGSASVDQYLCVAVTERNTMPLPTGAFTATVEYSGITNGMGRDDQVVTIGSIGRNGVTAHIPYLTTDERYNQRIVIVNRGGTADYSMTFSSEGGVMAAAGMEASGTLAANSTTVLMTSDVVTITGGPPHRASGMLSVVSASSDISVATNQTTRMGGSTDTVVYEVMGE